MLTYAALVLEYIIRVAKPKTIVFSTYGVREGLLYDMLPEREQQKDGLISAAETLNRIRSRSPRHAEELIGWTDRLVDISVEGVSDFVKDWMKEHREVMEELEKELARPGAGP